MSNPDLRFFRLATGSRTSNPMSAPSALEGTKDNLEELKLGTVQAATQLLDEVWSELNRLKQQRQQKLDSKSKIDGPSPILGAVSARNQAEAPANIQTNKEAARSFCT